MVSESTISPTDEQGEYSPPPPPAPPGATAIPGAPQPGRRGPGAVWWGLGLVLVGAALLVSQFFPAIQLWRFWPLIVIALGVRQMFGSSGTRWTVKTLTDGLVTVAFGLVFLGQMIGYLQWNVWLSILRLWPLLLVALGIEILGKGLRSEWVRALGGLVVIGGLAYGALVMTPTAGWPITLLPAGQSEPFEFSERRDPGVEEGAATIDGGVGSLSIQAGDRLATAEGRSPFEPVFDVDAGGRTASVRIGLGSGVWGPMEGDASLKATLDRDVIWDLEVSAGVTQYTADLRDLMISRLRLDAGVSDGTLTLGRSEASGSKEPIKVEIDAGVSALKIRVPEGDNVRVRIGQGLTGVTMRGEWTETRDSDTRVYEGRGFRDSDVYWDIEIDAGIGGITVEHY